MKAKNRITHRQSIRREEPLPHEVGAHLFAMIKRNLLARRHPATKSSPSQLIFAF